MPTIPAIDRRRVHIAVPDRRDRHDGPPDPVPGGGKVVRIDEGLCRAAHNVRGKGK